MPAKTSAGLRPATGRPLDKVDRLLGTETASYSDAYAASGEGYKGAVAQLKAETAEPQPRTNSYDTIDLLLSIVSILATSLP